MAVSVTKNRAQTVHISSALARWKRLPSRLCSPRTSSTPWTRLDHDAAPSHHSGRPFPEVERFFYVLCIPPQAPDAGDLLRRVRERVEHSFFIQASHGGRRRGGAERCARALGAAVRGANQVRLQRHEKTAAEIVAKRDAPEQLVSDRPSRCAHGESGGYDGATRGCAFVTGSKSVGLVGVAEHAVGRAAFAADVLIFV